MIDSSNPLWSKYYRALFPISQTCKPQTGKILKSEISFSTIGRTLMIFAIILSALKAVLGMCEVLIYSEIYGRPNTYIKKKLVIIGNIYLIFVVTLFLLCYYSKKGLQSYASFMNEFIHYKCSDDVGLELFRSFLDAQGFQKIFSANFWLLWFSLTFDLGATVSRLYYVGGLARVKE